MKNKTQSAQDTAHAMLKGDLLFCANYRKVRSNFTNGLIPAAQYRSIVAWQVADCFRRQGVPIRQARALQRAVAFAA